MTSPPCKRAFSGSPPPYPSPVHRHSLSTCNPNFLSPYRSPPSLIIRNDRDHERGHAFLLIGYHRRSFAFGEDEHEVSDISSSSDRLVRFDEAVKLFNEREYYACHDVLESLWYDSIDPLRTLLHALLQSAVAFHHLFNRNHKGAMMELGESVCKLRKLNFQEGPFCGFEQEISAVLNFIYQTQLELAACNEDFCVAIEQSKTSYQLLEGFGAGQRLYYLEQRNECDKNITYIIFEPQKSYGGIGVPSTSVKLPTLQATQNHLAACENM